MLWFKKKKKPECHLIIEPYHNNQIVIQLNPLDESFYKSEVCRKISTISNIRGLLLGSDVTYEVRKPAKD